MIVLHVLGELRPSGAEVMLLEAEPRFRQLGLKLEVLSTGESEGNFAGTYRRAGIAVHHLRFSKSATFATDFWQLLRRRRPDVVHIHTERANAALGVIARLAGVRTVVRTIHSVFGYTGGLRIVRAGERGLLRSLGVHHIAIGTAVERNELLRLRNPTTRIENWIGARFQPPSADEAGRARSGLGVDTDAYVISSIGNCSEVKNHSALLGALPQIAKAMKRRVVYLHAGSGELEGVERALTRFLPESAEARFLGSVEDVVPLLWASDAYCMPSRYEGLGIAALEALACGVPAVLSDVPGLRDVYAPSPSVKFVPPTEAGVLEGVLGLIAADPMVVAEAAESASRTVRERHSVVTQTRKLFDVYRNT